MSSSSSSSRLNQTQIDALQRMPIRWAQCSAQIHIATLMTLIRRGLVEWRPASPLGITYGYKSCAVHWRRTATGTGLLKQAQQEHPARPRMAKTPIRDSFY